MLLRPYFLSSNLRFHTKSSQITHAMHSTLTLSFRDSSYLYVPRRVLFFIVTFSVMQYARNCMSLRKDLFNIIFIVLRNQVICMKLNNLIAFLIQRNLPFIRFIFPTQLQVCFMATYKFQCQIAVLMNMEKFTLITKYL